MTTTEPLAERDEPAKHDERSEPAERDDSTERDGRRRSDEADVRSTETGRGPLDDVADTASASVRPRSDVETAESGRLWKLVAAVGGLSLFGAVAVVVLPGTVFRPVQFTNEAVRAMRSFALLLGAFVGVFGLYVAYHRERNDADDADSTASIELPAENPERAHGPTNDTLGSELDRRLDRIDGTAEAEIGGHYQAYKVRQTLRPLAVRVVADAADCSEARARRHVARGSWTDDVRAAAFLGGSDAPERPLSMRLRDWASGASFDRQVRATVDELAELDGGEGS